MPTNCPSVQHAADPGSQGPLWAIVGATASGKSSLAMALAKRLGAQLVACDSVQVYRDFDIGSAKPSRHDQALVPHHLIDVTTHDAPYDAQSYCTATEVVLRDLQARGIRPIVCGGTGLYLRALRYGLVPTTSAQPAFRAEQMAREARDPGHIYRSLCALDPASARAIGPHNIVQQLRALEISTVAQEPASAIRARHRATRQVRPMRLIQPVWPDAILRERIAERLEAMLAAGFVGEVENLLARGASRTCRPMGAVGYREVCLHLAGELSLKELAPAIAKSSWGYARRQRTWLRGEADVQQLAMQGDATDVERALALLTTPQSPRP